MVDSRHALHGRALLRSEPRGVPGFRAVLGVRVGAPALLAVHPQADRAGPDLRPARALHPRQGRAAAGEDRLLAAAAPALAALRDATGESAQLYKRQGDQRVCVAVAERLSGLRDSVPVGAALTMQAGSAAQVLLAWEDSEKIHRALGKARFTAAHLAAVRRRGWAQSVGEREAGVASVSAPVRGPNNKVIAAVGISGPIERLGRQPGRLHAAAIVATATKLSEYLAKNPNN